MAKKESYEEMLTKLQDILSNLETDDLNLEESMKSYEEGVKLVNKIYKILDSYEAKISIIKDDKELEFSEDYGDK
ncbi:MULTISPECIES: exodeoxyribonuclease VII small subunit [Clostridium]|jgi:Exodeoxyribonuclease VII small subunit (EC 3.1.11.6)|uniref:Exodeoxyribonuclease 7 small subunit n=3 Tax=Clostridium beijerinckii TaxID=1520 RepID=EX7S_CLOB8|nr:MULTISPECIES: exodeoxyribonuclease VII small subunit [Clostridium]A6LU46.1 RecName: Full=Exodeoxyribonuclease 7 small subunit; AltName: Full=Exodeoxyribonuclease VII small subunit; Short=Exonuclease VII small subunit [Clostridium beijerinckii NCIMB 8052]ABR33876.1 Exonuclease VII, small subunit [Clostridium beijerinckii NCIMB 8052]AIU02202.1 exonuclease VII, small subunit [Clostridium beijerinckii ATCC 35702]AJG98444.1 exodeoxyribonuclease VII small subunit [Clostridium beijerinckii]ALB4709